MWILIVFIMLTSGNDFEMFTAEFTKQAACVEAKGLIRPFAPMVRITGLCLEKK